MTSITLGRMAQRTHASEHGHRTGGLKTLVASFKNARTRRLAINEIRALRRQGLMDIEVDQIPTLVDGMLAKKAKTSS